MSTVILPQSNATVDQRQRVHVLNFGEQVQCQALILRLLEDARFFIQRTSGGTLAHKAALRMFNDLVAVNGFWISGTMH